MLVTLPQLLTSNVINVCTPFDWNLFHTSFRLFLFFHSFIHQLVSHFRRVFDITKVFSISIIFLTLFHFLVFPSFLNNFQTNVVYFLFLKIGLLHYKSCFVCLHQAIVCTQPLKCQQFLYCTG
jgi:hypothetical protein